MGIGEYAELGNVTRDGVKKDEEEFAKVLDGRKTDGKLKYVDISKKEHEVEVKEMMTLHDVVEKVKETYPGLTHNRVPVCNSASPHEADFDTIRNALQGTPINTPVIINCQVGLSRSTTGCIIACLFREFQLAAGFEGLVETVPGVNLELLKMDRYKMDPSKDPLSRGEFEVIKELCSVLPDGESAKAQCDKIIDKNGPAKTGGTGIKLPKTSAQYMEEHANLRTVVEEGKGKLMWDRPIPPEALAGLEALSKDFQANLGKIIHDIYAAANGIFRNLPQGDHKKRAKYRFASKTLMCVLPTALKSEVEQLIADKKITLDLYEILGHCTWGQVKIA